MLIIANGRAQASVVIPAGASQTNRFAAEELIQYLKKMSGVALTLYEDSYPLESAPERFEICIGPVDREGRPGTDGLKNDGYRLTLVGNRFFIQGENDRGILYGVYGLLERVLGCRFFAPGVEKIPVRREIDLPAMDREIIPPFEYRETSWNCYFDPDIAYKRGLNGHRHGIDPKRGGCISYYGFVHTFARNYISPEEYFDEHPEYFSMVDGKRLRDRSQLCLTNPEVFAIVRDKLRRNIEEHPEATIFSISQNDWYNPCQCPECARIDEEEGSHAGTLIRFVNALARDIAGDYPHVIIDTLAYQYTRQAPKITKPEPNVAVRVCSIECCFTHPLAECDVMPEYFKKDTPEGASLQKDMADWAKICNRIHVWDYTTQFRHYLNPMPDFYVLQPNIQFFIKNGVTGLFEQGNRESVSGECGELRAYLISRLMWEPDMNVSQAMNEFLSGYYGQAGAPIREYIDMIARHVEENHIHMGIFDNPTHGHITDEMLDAADRLWDEAEALADDEDVLYRVQCSRMQVRYCRMNRMAKDDPARAEVVEGFIQDLHRFGFTRTREARDLEKSIEQIRAGQTNDIW